VVFVSLRMSSALGVAFCFIIDVFYFTNSVDCKHVKIIMDGVILVPQQCGFSLISPLFLFMQSDVFLLTSNAMSYNSADTVYHRQVIFSTMLYCCIVCTNII
jgi:hypothetical protein